MEESNASEIKEATEAQISQDERSSYVRTYHRYAAPDKAELRRILLEGEFRHEPENCSALLLRHLLALHHQNILLLFSNLRE